MGKNKYKYQCVKKRNRRNILNLEKAREARKQKASTNNEESQDPVKKQETTSNYAELQAPLTKQEMVSHYGDIQDVYIKQEKTLEYEELQDLSTIRKEEPEKTEECKDEEVDLYTGVEDVEMFDQVEETTESGDSNDTYFCKEKFIKVVASHREVYETKYSIRHEALRRQLAWQEISKSMNMPVAVCKTKWRRIKDTYSNTIKSRMAKMKRFDEGIKSVRNANIMSFLNPYIIKDYYTQCKNLRSLLGNNENQSIANVLHNPEKRFPKMNAQHIPEQHHIANSTISTERCLEVTGVPPEPLPTTSDFHKTHLEENTSQQNRDILIEDFFKNLGETVKEFPEELQIHVKQQINKVISDAESVHRNKSPENIVFVVCKTEPE